MKLAIEMLSLHEYFLIFLFHYYSKITGKFPFCCSQYLYSILRYGHPGLHLYCGLRL